MDRQDFEYEMVDVPVHKGRPAIDPILHVRAQDGWRPVTVIEPTEDYPSYTIVFERALTSNPYDPELEYLHWARWNVIHKEKGDPHP